MKRAATIFLQVVIVVFGLGVLLFLLWEPHFEGRNTGATTAQIYFHDPFLAYAYIASVPFFLALWQMVKLLRYTRQNKVFSVESVQAVRMVKYYTLAFMAFVLGAEIYFNFVQRGQEDIAGGVMLGNVMLLFSAIVVTGSILLQKTLQHGTDIQSEHDLTV